MNSFTKRLEIAPLDKRKWQLLRPFDYHVGSADSEDVIAVPAGFITDFASVPVLVSPIFTISGLALAIAGMTGWGAAVLTGWGVAALTLICVLSWFRKWGKHGKAAIVHDWLYQTGLRTRKEADDIFLEAMLVLGTARWRAHAMHRGVRWFSWLAWHPKKQRAYREKSGAAMTDSASPTLRLSEVGQIGIVVSDSAKVMESWTALFGIGPWRIVEWDVTGVDSKPAKVKLCFADLGGVQLELIEPVEGRVFHNDFLDKHGEGLHHLGFQVGDVDGEARNLTEAGASVLSAMPGQFAYLGTGGPGGVIFEVIRRPEQQ